MSTPLADVLRRHIRTHGPMPFRDFMAAALYDPQYGYYTSARNPIGRGGDFYTSPDLDVLFGKLIARRLRGMAHEAGVDPQSFTIVELGAGTGRLARDILNETPFPYYILERSPAMRERQRTELAGLSVRWIDDLPQAITGCVLSNEFFDALPVRRLVRRGGVLREVYVTDDFKEIAGDLQTPIEVPLAEGQLADINADAVEWVRRIGASIDRGFHLAVDYGYLDREFYARPRGTLMCYWKHQAVEDPYIRIGEQDMTAHVNFSDLMEAGRTAGLETIEFTTQMQFLIGLGILDEIEALAGTGTAESIQRLTAVKKLILPGSLGERFKVLTQRKVPPAS